MTLIHITNSSSSAARRVNYIKALRGRSAGKEITNVNEFNLNFCKLKIWLLIRDTCNTINYTTLFLHAVSFDGITAKNVKLQHFFFFFCETMSKSSEGNSPWDVTSMFLLFCTLCRCVCPIFNQPDKASKHNRHSVHAAATSQSRRTNTVPAPTVFSPHV